MATATNPDLNVWMPRPQWQLKAIIGKAQAQGIYLHSLPVIDIEFIANPELATQLANADALLFTSQNAVLGCVEAKQLTSALNSKKIIAIGQATANLLSDYQINCDYVALPPFTSEALLDDKRFWVLGFRSLALVSGEGGRDVLLRRISEQNINIQKVSVYRRHKAKIPPRNMIEFLRLNNIKAVAMTSVEIAEAVTETLNEANLREQLALLVVFTFGERIAEACRELGYQQVYSAKAASQTALLELIEDWRKGD